METKFDSQADSPELAIGYSRGPIRYIGIVNNFRLRVSIDHCEQLPCALTTTTT